jgi:hypothetical protein
LAALADVPVVSLTIRDGPVIGSVNDSDNDGCDSGDSVGCCDGVIDSVIINYQTERLTVVLIDSCNSVKQYGWRY